jgi:hypothetical protein
VSVDKRQEPEGSGGEDATSVRAHEDGIPAFLLPPRAARFKATIGSTKGRAKTNRAGLAHRACDFDPRHATKLSSSLDVPDIEELLRAAGAPTRCYVLSEHPDLDGRLLDLHEALDSILFDDYGALVSCIPGRLALFSDEAPGDQWLLRRTAER